MSTHSTFIRISSLNIGGKLSILAATNKYCRIRKKLKGAIVASATLVK